jgi:HPt (histidine-containing phosphotransfer) domain-containing protein
VRQPVDVSSLLELRGLQQPGQPDFIARIVTHFLQETTERLLTLHKAVDTDDANLLEQAAHALKGITGTVGANEMLDLAVRLEECGLNGHTDGALELVIELEGALGRARPVFDRLRDAG